ncbi:MAG TPA: hypothetical protein PLX23_06990 [Candidatus Hydrogenedens sp.]|nr:hypothetical protein [Candidatus Hydrogenedens sp.]
MKKMKGIKESKNTKFILKQGFFIGFCFACFILFSFPAYVLDIDAEGILVKITEALDPETNPDTMDVDNNGIPDRAHTRLLDRVLSDETVPNHELLVSIYYFNWTRIKVDNTLGNKCIAIQQLYGITCDEVERFAAAIITIGEPMAIQYFVQGAISAVGIKIDLKNYNLGGGLFLRASADLDGDGISNRREFLLADGDFNLFVEKAITPEELPEEGENEIPILDEDVPLIITPAIDSPVDFGSISLKTSKEIEFKAQNIGMETIPFQIWIMGEPEFQIIGERVLVVDPQETVSFKVRFTPKSYIKSSGILVIETYGRKYYVYLGGQGSWIKNLFSCSGKSNNIENNNYKGDLLVLLITVFALGIAYNRKEDMAD